MTIKSVNATTLKSWIDNGEAVLVDVREVVENKACRIKSAKLIPLGEVAIDKLPKMSNQKLVIHCKSGKRGVVACEKLVSSNLEIYNLEGGIEAWKDCGFEVLTADQFFIPLERQVQIVAGSIIFFGTALGLLASGLFFIVPLFAGAGLVFAGCTGYCGLGMVLAKLPFNQKNKN